MNLTKTLFAAGALALALGAHATTAEAKDPTTKVKVGKGGVSVETGNTKVNVGGAEVDVDAEGGSVDVETDDGETTVKTAKGAKVAKQVAEAEAEGEALSIVGNGKTLTHVCGGDKHGATVIDITGNHHKVTLKGACQSVTITGNGHSVTMEQIGSITATGNKIQVQWKKALRGDKPEITQTGNGIRISKIVEK